MPRKFEGSTLLIATHNPGKVPEIAALLGGYVREFPTAGSLGLPEPEETGATFAENAILKAAAAASASNLPSLADDSGLCVAALNGDPGVYSARWAGPGRDFTVALRKVEDGLQGKADRSAAFVSVLALAWPDGHVETFEGRIPGRMAWPARGQNGFGYDPVFIPEGHHITFAEMDPTMKRRISHRARAFEKLVQGCFAPDKIQ